MPITPEGRVKKKVTAVLKKYGCYYHMPVQHGRGSPALDYHVCAFGMYLGIETKAPGKLPTPRQSLTMSEIGHAGGFTMVIDGDEAVEKLEAALLLLKKASPLQYTDTCARCGSPGHHVTDCEL